MTKRPRGDQILGMGRYVLVALATELLLALVGCRGSLADLGGSTQSGAEGGSPAWPDTGTPPSDATRPPIVDASMDTAIEAPFDDDASEGAPPPPDDLLDATFEAGPAPVIDASTYFGWMQQAMIGTWIGTRTDPWDQPATVTVTFFASGVYSAHCVVSDPTCEVWHAGVDEDLPEKTYQLYDLHANQTGEAYIEICWNATDCQQDRLDNIAIDPTATMMNLDFYHVAGEPVHLALVRQ